jgi:hypothetical protein
MRTVAKGTIEGRIDCRMCRTQFMRFTETVSNYAENKYEVKHEKVCCSHNYIIHTKHSKDESHVVYSC